MRTRNILATLSSVLLAGCCSVTPDEAFVKQAEQYHALMEIAVLPLTDADSSNDPDLSGSNGEGLRLAHEAQELAIRRARQAIEEMKR